MRANGAVDLLPGQTLLTAIENYRLIFIGSLEIEHDDIFEGVEPMLFLFGNEDQFAGLYRLNTIFSLYGASAFDNEVKMLALLMVMIWGR